VGERRGLRIVVASVLVFAAVGGVFAMGKGREYRARAYVIQVPAALGPQRGVELARSERVLRQTIAFAGIEGIDLAELRRRSAAESTSRLDIAAAIGELKAKPGGELQVHGNGALFRWLLDNDLVDEMTLFTCPVVVGQGTRLFPDTGRDRALELVESRATPSGVTIQVYRPTGRPEYATATAD
jgi:riboflavin biosynthesis pyrimidine reductase